jgi:DNA ligase 1
MRAFAGLLERLVLTPSRNRKLELLVHYFRERPDPDRGYGLAAITGVLDLPAVKPGLIRQLAAEATDPELFRLSYDYVGDLAETVALIWPTDNRDRTIDLPLRKSSKGCRARRATRRRQLCAIFSTFSAPPNASP